MCFRFGSIGYEKLALEFVLPGHDKRRSIFLDAIHHKMTRNLVKLQGVLAEEVSRNMDAALGDRYGELGRGQCLGHS